MDKITQLFLEGIKVGAKQSHENMTLYCLLKAEETDVDFMTLDEALDKGSISITEKDEAGNVPELKVVNRSDRKVLLIDGEELVGAKQNRVLNVTVLIAPNSETIIPVSCVEQGRWSYQSNEFRSESRAMSPRLKQRKTQSVTAALLSNGLYRSDQSMVWDEIDAKYARMATQPSATHAMSDLYESHRGVSKKYLKAFHAVDNQVGIIVFIDGELAGVEILARFDAFRKTHEKMVSSYVMDAIETAAGGTAGDMKRPTRVLATKTLEVARDASVQRRRSVALGEDIRLEAEDLVGAGLEFEGHVVHLTLFKKDDGEQSGGRKHSMTRASRRRESFFR